MAPHACCVIRTVVFVRAQSAISMKVYEGVFQEPGSGSGLADAAPTVGLLNQISFKVCFSIFPGSVKLTVKPRLCVLCVSGFPPAVGSPCKRCVPATSRQQVLHHGCSAARSPWAKARSQPESQ